ncbi:MAG: hypothetical protein GY703_18095 [Gammaproteobacteria bacterium]|nr:hypothetical protein [Gammaproteobacteria bacterium]
MNRTVIKAVVGTLTLLMLYPLCSAGANTRQYNVEMIIFERANSGSGSTEYWSDDPGAPDLAGARTPESFTVLPISSRRMGPEQYSLQRMGQGVKPLLHTAWRQTIYGESRTTPVHIRSTSKGSDGSPRMEGTVSISVNRFLHVRFDLLLRESQFSGGGNQTYRFKSHRRMRSGEIHYLDHPKLGALIRIDRGG